MEFNCLSRAGAVFPSYCSVSKKPQNVVSSQKNTPVFQGLKKDTVSFKGSENTFVLTPEQISLSGRDRWLHREKEEMIRDVKAQITEKYGEDAIKNSNPEKILPFFGINVEKDEDGKLIISEYKQPRGHVSPSLYFKDLGIDENILLKDVKEIKKNGDFYCSTATDLRNLVSVGGFANFQGSSVKNLEKLKSVGGYADFSGIEVKLDNLEHIGGDADFGGSHIRNISKLRHIGGNARFNFCHVNNLDSLEHIGGTAYFRNCPVTNLGNLKYIGGHGMFEYTSLDDLHSLEYVGKSFDCPVSVKELPNLRYIGEDADFRGSDVRDLSNLKHVGGNIFLERSKVNRLTLLPQLMNSIKEKIFGN